MQLCGYLLWNRHREPTLSFCPGQVIESADLEFAYCAVTPNGTLVAACVASIWSPGEGKGLEAEIRYYELRTGSLLCTTPVSALPQ